MWQQWAGKPVAEATMKRGSSDPQPPVLPTLFVVFSISVFTFHLVISNQPFLSDYSRSQLAKVTGSLALCLLVKNKKERMSPSAHADHPETPRFATSSSIVPSGAAALTGPARGTVT